MKNSLVNYAESEFFELIKKAHKGDATGQDIEDLVDFLDTLEYEEESALITHPLMFLSAFYHSTFFLDEYGDCCSNRAIRPDLFVTPPTSCRGFS